jgi:ATP-binding cassette, subfamily B, bacterial
MSPLMLSSWRRTVPALGRMARAIRLVWASGRGWTLASVALVFVQSALPLVQLYLLKLLIDAVAAAVTTDVGTSAFPRIALLLALAAGAALLGAVSRSLAGLVSEGQARAVSDHLHALVHAKAASVDLEYFESARYHDTLHRAQQEGAYRPTRIVNGVVQVVQSTLALLLMAGVLVAFHWATALVLFAAAVPGVLVRLRQAGRTYESQRAQTQAERRAQYYHAMLTGAAHAKELRLFGLGALFSARHRDLREEIRRQRLRVAGWRFRADVVTQVTATLAVFGSFAFILYRASLGALTVGDVVMYYQAFQRGQDFLKDILGGLAALYEDHLFLASLYEFLDLDRRIVEPATPRPVPRPLRSGIVFDGVSFQYPGAPRKVLRDVSLTIRPGEQVALVGANGSGKSTLVKLLCRLYDPSGGVITIDGIDVRDFETAAYRREISAVFQDWAAYHVSARDNIWFGDPRPDCDDARIRQAARDAGADEVIARLGRGYDTLLGTWFEQGEELSMGEWQKIALARAFVRDTQIVVLDEPTSFLDVQAEHEVFARFRHLAAGRSTIVISHRLSTVRTADRIYLLEDGRIAESGCHDELMRHGGAYARLFDTQAQSYR